MTFDPAVPAPTNPTSATTSPDVQAQQNTVQQQERAQVAESEARGEPPAERPTDQDTTVFGQSLGGRRELGGGGNIEEHTLNDNPAAPRDPLYYQRRYLASRLHREAGTVIARSPDNIGFWGKGDTYRGNGGILVDVDTLEKHRFPDGYRFEGDEVYANSRDLPPVLVEGNLGANLSGEAARAGEQQRAGATRP